MTRDEAIKVLLSRFEIGATCVAYEYDPAGSDSSYVPHPRDVEIVQAFIERPLAESDFGFSVGCGNSRSRFYIGEALRRELGLI